MTRRVPVASETERLARCYAAPQVRAIRAEALHHARHYRHWAREYAADGSMGLTVSEYQRASLMFRRRAAEARAALVLLASTHAAEV